MENINKERMRIINNTNVLRLLATNNEMSKTDIAHKLNCSIPSISSILQELISKNLVRHLDNNDFIGRGKSSGLYKFNRNYEKIICININPTSMSFNVSNIYGQTITKYPTIDKVFKNKEIFLDTISTQLDKILKKTHNISKVAISMHGGVDFIKGISIYSPHNKWNESVNIKSFIEQKHKVKCILDNDCNVLTLSQKWKFIKNQNPLDTFMLINLDFGVGSGILINNNLFRGKHFDAGQIGHIPIYNNGKQCSCGNYGCLETIMSTTNILNNIKEKVKNGSETILNKLENIDDLTFNDIIFALNKKDTFTISVMEENLLYLAMVLTNVVCTLDINNIIITGEIAKLDTILTKTITKYMNKRFNTLKNFKVDKKSKLFHLQTSNLTTDEIHSSPALLWLEKLINIAN